MLVSQERYLKKKKKKVEMQVVRSVLWELELLPRAYEVEGKKETLALNMRRTGRARPPNTMIYRSSWENQTAGEVTYGRRLVTERWRHRV